MKFKLKYNKTAQFYFYLSNLSNWHFSCVSEYNWDWLRQVNGPSKEEILLLSKLITLHKKYDFDDTTSDHYLGKPFIDSSEANIWENVKNLVDQDEYLILNEIFTVFEPKLNILWKNDKIKLNKLERALEQELKQPKAVKAINITENLFGQAIDHFVIHLFAIPANSPGPAGGANTEEGVVTLELRSRKDIEDGLFVALHEIAHQLIRKSKIIFDEAVVNNSQKLTQIPIFKEQGIQSAWEEVVIACFLPDGFVKNLLTGNEPDKKGGLNIESRKDLEHYLIFQSQHKIEEYLNQNKLIDQGFANFVLNESLRFVSLTR